MLNPRIGSLTGLAVAAAMLVGCASDGDSAESAATSTSTDQQTSQRSGRAEAGVRHKITLRGGKASPAGQRLNVKKGQQVRLEVSADQRDTVHVHGYDLERPVAPGKPAIIEFTADQDGLFEVETHDSSVLLVQLAVK